MFKNPLPFGDLPEDGPEDQPTQPMPTVRASRPPQPHPIIHQFWQVTQRLTSKQVVFLVLAFLIVFSALSGGIAFIQAASQPVKLPVPPAKMTLKDLLNQPKGIQTRITPGGKSRALPFWPKGPKEDPKNLPPSAQPAQMKPVSQTVSLKTVGNAPTATPTPGITPTPGATSTPTPQPTPDPTKPTKGKPTPTPSPTPDPTSPAPSPTPTGTAPTSSLTQNWVDGLAQTTQALNADDTDIHLIGTDSSGNTLLDIVIPAGSLDASAAKTASGAAPQGNLTLTLSELHGHFVAEMKLLGYFQIQVTDAAGQVVHGLKLTQPATIAYHYQSNELTNFGVDPESMVIAWTDLLAAAPASTSSADLVSPMNADATTQTLTAQTTIFDTSSLSITGDQPEDESPSSPHQATVSGNTGQLSYAYPLEVAPGPPGTEPDLVLTYSSGIPNQRHSVLSPAGYVGDGWSLQLGSITAETADAGSADGAKIWYSLSSVDGVSDRLVNPDDGTNTQSFETEHLSHLKINKLNVTVGGNAQRCFHVYDTDDNYYEFGCTADSLQYYTSSDGTKHNYRWDLNKLVPANNGNTARIMTVSYVQDTNILNSHTSIRDAAIKQIVYGNGTTAGTVNFYYRGPNAFSSNGTQWITAYGTNYQCSSPPTSTTLRCDDPLDRSGGLKKPLVMSTLSLTKVESYVGAYTSGVTTNLDYSYSFTYTDTPFSTCNEPATWQTAYCAGEHVLTQVTPTVYQNGTGHVLPEATFTYGGPWTLHYEDAAHQVNSHDFSPTTSWKYLTSYFDKADGSGATIQYNEAHGNTNGTPALANGDNRYDALFCAWSPSQCYTAQFPRQDGKQWSVQVVTGLTPLNKDSSASASATTMYQYWLTQGSATGCTADSTGMTDCVRDTWIPNTGATDWQDYYDGEFRGFASVLETSPAGNLTVQQYATGAVWSSPESAVSNYTAGHVKKALIYAGGQMNDANLIQKTENLYAGDGNGGSDKNACNFAYTGTVYDTCEVLLQTQTVTTYEKNGANDATSSWVKHDYTYDDYRGGTSGYGNYAQAPATGAYGNLQQEVISASNAPTVTQKWTYDTTNTASYYNVNNAAHSELVDGSSHIWSCQDTIYDEGAGSTPTPAAGWATTVKTYSDCANQATTAIKSYSGYDVNGNALVTVDGVGAATPSLYSSGGCTQTRPSTFYISSAWSGSHFTTCTTYNGTGALPTDTYNALGHHTITTYDATQGLLPTKVTDVNNRDTTTAYSYDANGNVTTSISQPGETGSYTSRSTMKTNCTATSTLPCLEVDSNTSLYQSALTRTFYDGLGRAVETLTPGPGASQTTVQFIVYNDTTDTVFESVPFVVASRTTWLDPNGATDGTGATPGGTLTTHDPLGRVLASTDPLGNQTRMFYSVGSISGDSNSYTLVTSVDANQHVQASYSDALSRTRYVLIYSGTYGGTLTATMRRTTQYNALDLPTSLTVTDLAPQTGQTITSVTTTSQYDDLGRLTQLVDPDRGTHTFTYDANNNVVTDVSNSRTIGTSYDLLERIGCVQDAAPTPTIHGTCTTGAHAFTQNTYDTDPGAITGGAGDPIGRLTQAVSTTRSPDGLQGVVTESMQYDQRGRLTTNQMVITASGGSFTLPTLPTYQETLAYNNDDQQTTTQTTIGGQPGYAFTQIYDSTTGILSGLSSTTTGPANLATLSYNEHALPADIVYNDTAGNPLATQHITYDGNLRPASTSTTWQSNGSVIASDGLSFDAMSNVLSRVTTHASISGISGSGGNETQNYCYDALDRLSWSSNNTASSPGTNEHCGNASLQQTLGGNYTKRYAYTNLGQLWQGPLTGSSTQEQYLYCDSAHPHQLNSFAALSASPTCAAPGTKDYAASYDAFGNMTSRGYNSQNATLTYDPLDTLAQWSAGSQHEWYFYNSTGERVLKRSYDGSTTKLTVYAFGLEEHQYLENGSGGASNTGNTYYYMLNGNLLGTLTGTSSLTTNFLLSDSLGSVIASFSNLAGSAQVLGNQLYDPYGNSRYKQGSIGTDKGYTGQYADSLSGLDYNHARYYDTVIGRFITADTVQGNPQGFDPYAYGAGNPETNNDPTGHMAMMYGNGGGSAPPPPITPPSNILDHVDYNPCPSIFDCVGVSFHVNTIHPVNTTVTHNIPIGGGGFGLGPCGFGVCTLQPKNPGGSIEVHNQVRGFTTSHIDLCLGQCFDHHGDEEEGKGTGGSGKSKCSFTPDTDVTTDQGPQAIGTLHEGDQVLAYNPDTQQMELQPVTHVWINHDDDLLDLTLTASTDTSQDQEDKQSNEVIHTTMKHPFLTEEQGFLQAGQLVPGMHILRADGSVGEVTQWQVVPGSAVMYNLTVAHDHTYTVGDGQWVVHNAGGCGKNLLKAGEVGRFGSLESRAVVGDKLTPHHVPQGSLAGHFGINYDDFAAVMMDEAQHTKTFNYGGKAIAIKNLVKMEGYNFRQVLAMALWKDRALFPNRNETMREIIDYWEKEANNLMQKPPRNPS